MEPRPLRLARTIPDPLLARFLRAASDREAEHLLVCVLREHAEPILQGILRSKWRVSRRDRGGHVETPWEREAQDVYSEAVAHLVARLRDWRADPDRAAIADFRAYVAVAAFHACDRVLRNKYPQRACLADRLRRLLARRPELALWRGNGGETLCGLACWPERARGYAVSPRLQQLREDPRAAADAALPVGDHGQPVVLLPALFRWLGHPIALRDLVGFLTDLWDLRDETTASWSAEDASAATLHECLPDKRADVAITVERRVELERLWAEIRLLPPRQRAALLLNLCDAPGQGVIALFPLTAVATVRDIAAALETPAEEFAALWERLPLDDDAIAGRLGVTCQQVRSLRRVARLRLERRLRRGDERPA